VICVPCGTLPSPGTEDVFVRETFATDTGTMGKLALSESEVAPDEFGTVWLTVAVLTSALEVLTVTVMTSEAESPDASDGMAQVTVGTPATEASVTDVPMPSVVVGAVPAGEP
jgi:hypothetical protein